MLGLRFLTASILVTACVSPPPLSGTGVRGTFGGDIYVTVVDARTLAPILGAAVLLDGEAVGETDLHGALHVSHAAVDLVEASASGYEVTGFAGADAEVYTIPLRATAPAPTATVRGEVAGFGDVEAPAGGTVRAIIGVSRDKAIDGADPVMARCEGGDACTFTLTAPIGQVRLFAQILGVDPGPTPDPSDDVVTPLSFALSDPLQLMSGETREAVRLERFADTALTEVTVTTPPAASGIDAVVGVPGLGLGDDVLVFVPEAGQTRFLLPTPSGSLAQTNFWGIARGTGPGGESIAVIREPRASAPAHVAPPDLAAIPTVTRSGESYVIGGADGAVIVEVRVDGVARVFAFDGRREIEAPAGAGSVVAYVAPAQEDGWDLTELRQTFTQRMTAELP